MRVHLPVERNTAYPSVFLWVRNITFLQKSPIQVNGRSTVSLVREPLMLEARSCSNVDNGLRF
jgi:hypothetical protein